MNLFIDTSLRDKIILRLDNDEFQTDAHQDASQKLLQFIVSTLEKQNKRLSDISSISINPGPGSFTGLRVGAAVAQTLSWGLQIPLNRKDINELKFIRINYSIDNK